MNLRLARAAAVSGFVIIALTGASGCSGDSGEKGSAAAGSASAADDSTGAVDTRDPKKDISVAKCEYADKQGIVAKLSATNDSATSTYTYDVTVKFTAPDGTALAPQNTSILFVRPGRTDNREVTTAWTPKAGAATTGAKCEIDKVTRGTG